MDLRPILVLAGVVLGILFLGGLCVPETPSAELARTTRDAVGLARDAVAQGASAGRLRLLAVVLGVSIPIIVVYMIWRSSARDQLDASEVIEAMERLELTPPQDPAKLPRSPSTVEEPRER